MILGKLFVVVIIALMIISIAMGVAFIVSLISSAISDLEERRKK